MDGVDVCNDIRDDVMRKTQSEIFIKGTNRQIQ
jgi:hypothetical protein